MVEAATSRKVQVHRSAGVSVDHGIQRHRPDIQISSRKSKVVQGSGVDVELVEVELAHQSHVRTEVIANATVEVPSGVESPARSADSLSESGADVERYWRCFLCA